MGSTTKADQNWEKFHLQKVRQNYPKWPNEIMVKLAFGSYLAKPLKVIDGMRVLDVGCGFGNNLYPFLDKGCDCYGTEVTEATARLAQDLAKQRGLSCVIKHGYNQKLPFDDSVFDLLLSINVLHYEKTDEDIDRSLREYCRVLKNDGAMILITVGPEHAIYKKAKVVGHHRYLVQNFDFRDGEQYYYFDNTKYLDATLSNYFGDIETGQVTERLMQKPLDFLVAVARDKKL
jgi:SAM-dependent methyltransferase